MKSGSIAETRRIVLLSHFWKQPALLENRKVALSNDK